MWLDHYRRLQLQDGAFMAMLLDSYVVEPGQPWWLYLGLFHCFGRFFFSFFVVPMAAWCFLGGDNKNTTVGIGDEMAACLGLIVQMELKDLALKGNQVV